MLTRPSLPLVPLCRVLSLLAVVASLAHCASPPAANAEVPIAEDEVELLLDTDPWGLAPSAFQLDPEPLYYVPVFDGRVHAIYAKDTPVAVTAARLVSGVWFDHWSGDLASGSSSPGSLFWCTLAVAPPDPSSSQKITVRLSGEWFDTGVPNELHVTVLDNTIHLDAVRNYAPGTPFLDVITPWSLEQEIGPLAPGIYSVLASLRSEDGGPAYPEESLGTFTVGEHRDNPLSVLMDRSKALTAQYIEKETALLILDSEPWGLALLAYTLDPEPLEVLPTDDGRLHAIYDLNAEVAITAHTVDDHGKRYRFDHWESGGAAPGPTDNPLVVVMDGDKSFVGHFVEVNEVELTLDTDPAVLTFSAFTLDPEPIRYEPIRDGRIHAIYWEGTEVAMYAAEQIGDLHFDYWDEPESPLPVIYTDNPHVVTLYTPRYFRAHYVAGKPSPPGLLVIDTRSTLDGKLNPDGPACRSLGIVSIDPNGNSPDTLYAMKIGESDTAGWLRYCEECASPIRQDVYPDGTEPQWHTAADWATRRLRGLQPGTTHTFRALAENGAGESPLGDVGTYSTNRACDVNRSGLATALDYAFIRLARIRGGALGVEVPWACDVDDSRAVDDADLDHCRSRILHP